MYIIKTDKRTIITDSFDDLCIREVIKTNYEEQGHSREEAEDYFWKQVENHNKKDWNQVLDGKNIKDCLDKYGNIEDWYLDGITRLINNYIYSLGIVPEEIKGE